LPANPPPGGGTARAEPQLEEPAGESAPKVTMQQTMSDEMNIEIPAFLRRQSS
jgi:hypothetical protein